MYSSRSKKRVTWPEKWKRNRNEVLRQSGKAYTDVTEKVKNKKKVDGIACTHSKTYKHFFGSSKFHGMQDIIHLEFWSLKYDDKGHFFQEQQHTLLRSSEEDRMSSGWNTNGRLIRNQYQHGITKPLHVLTKKGARFVWSPDWQHLGINVTSLHPVSSKGNVYILTVIDHFTKWVELFPMKNQEASTVTKILVHWMICVHCLQTSVSDGRRVCWNI